MNDSSTTYFLYGLTVRSEVELPELRTNQSVATADVTVRRATLDPIPGSETDPNIQRIEASPDRCRITYESLGTFLIESGERVLYDPFTPEKATEKIFRRLLQNQAMTVLLLQRGLLVLHASAVSVGGKAVVFLGSQTAGKSTMTAAFHQEGHPMIADDVVAIRVGNAIPTVVPGVPQIRLSVDSIEGLNIDNTIEYKNDWGPEKAYQHIDNQSNTVPLGGIYTLNESEAISITDLDGSVAFRELVTNTYAQGLLSDTDAITEHFEQCTAILNQVSPRQINRPKDFERLPEVIGIIAKDVNEYNGDIAPTAE